MKIKCLLVMISVLLTACVERDSAGLIQVTVPTTVSVDVGDNNIDIPIFSNND